jgi:Ca2+-binding RTX toxin-like protein
MILIGDKVTENSGEGTDTITDFNRVQSDKIQINRAGFGIKNLAARALQNDRFVLKTTSLDQGDRFIFNTENNTLFFDQDGIGTSFKQRAIAVLSNDIDAIASNIILV